MSDILALGQATDEEAERAVEQMMRDNGIEEYEIEAIREDEGEKYAEVTYPEDGVIGHLQTYESMRESEERAIKHDMDNIVVRFDGNKSDIDWEKTDTGFRIVRDVSKLDR